MVFSLAVYATVVYLHLSVANNKQTFRWRDPEQPANTGVYALAKLAKLAASSLTEVLS